MKSYDEYYTNLTQLFEKSYASAYKATRKQRKNKLLKYGLSFYRRWYYSAFIEDSLLTPSNLFDVLNREFKVDGCTLTVPIIKSHTRFCNLNYKTQSYTLDCHPVVKDLEIFLSFCSPVMALTAREGFLPELETALLKQVSLYDPYYLEYLLALSLELDLVQKMLAIHFNQIQRTEVCEAFFQEPTNQIMEKIIRGTVALSTKNINEMMPGNHFIGMDYIYSILKEPITTDDLFKYIYAMLGLSIEQLIEFQTDDVLDEMYNAMVSSTFYLGVILDKYFFTPFGFYLRLINPGYLLPYNVNKEMFYATEALEETEDLSAIMFSPCSHYTLTSIGLEFFQLIGNQPNLFDFPKEVNFNTIMGILNQESGQLFDLPSSLNHFLINDSTHQESKKVYELQIKVRNKKNYWKYIEFLEANTLHDLYMEICYEFNIDINMNYSFYYDLNENPFTEYHSPHRKKSRKNSEIVELKDFNLLKNHIFLAVIYDAASPFSKQSLPLPLKKLKFDIEVRSIKDKEKNQVYPRVINESPTFQELDLDWLF